MRLWLEINRASGEIEKRKVSPSRGGAAAARVEGACPGCCASPFYVKCHAASRVDRDTMRAGSRCVACGDPVGYVYLRADTIFGLEEDERVLVHGRARVY